MSQIQQVRIQVHIRGFDTFDVTAYGQDGAVLSSITYTPADFGDDFIDLDSHTFDFTIDADGQLQRVPQTV
jgi:hypothetical protein